ncbi:MAG: PAS domain S-box protein, partial [Dehalococcoidales bacterium]
MKDEEKTKNELISELTELRNRLLKSERSETQLGLAKKLLEENEKSHRTFYEEAPIACFSVDSDGYIKMANQTATAFLGYTSGELVDRQMLDLFVGISIEKAREILALVQAGEEIRGG